MEENYVEKLVSKKTDTKAIALRTVTIVAVVFVLYLSLFYLGTLGLLIYGLVAVFFLIWLVYYVFCMTSVEYEFVLVKNELSIDIIYGKNKRKNQQTIDVSKCELIAPAESMAAAPYHKANQMQTFDYTSGNGQEEIYLLVIPYGASKAKLYMEADKKMLDAFRMVAPGKVKEID